MTAAERTIKEQEFITSVTQHMKELSHKVMKFDTRDEVLNYTAQMFAEHFKCDLVAVGTIANNQIELSSSNTKKFDLSPLFPFPTSEIDPRFFQTSMSSESAEFLQNTQVSRYFENIGFQSWFTVPLIDDQTIIGLCIVGYQNKNVLYHDLQNRFDEMGKFIGVALNLISRNEEKEKSLFEMQMLSSDLNLSSVIESLVKKNNRLLWP